jgi:hypothetical protein
MMIRGEKTKVEFTNDDVRLVRLIGELWDQGMARMALHYGHPASAPKGSEPEKLSHFPRIADTIEAEVTGQPLKTRDPLGGFRPGDGGFVKASVPLARNPDEARAMRDLAARLAAHVPKKLVFKNPDGSSVTVTRNTISFKQKTRRRSK